MHSGICTYLVFDRTLKAQISVAKLLGSTKGSSCLINALGVICLDNGWISEEVYFDILIRFDQLIESRWIWTSYHLGENFL